MAGLLAPVAQALGAQFHRSPTTVLSCEQSPALPLFPESDGIVERANDRVARQLVVRIDAMAREDGGVAAEDQANRLLVAAHAALFADASLGGLVLGIRELDREWDVEDADATAARIPAHYQITYRTRSRNIRPLGLRRVFSRYAISWTYRSRYVGASLWISWDPALDGCKSRQKPGCHLCQDALEHVE